MLYRFVRVNDINILQHYTALCSIQAVYIMVGVNLTGSYINELNELIVLDWCHV